jgi:hypothetical protein
MEMLKMADVSSSVRLGLAESGSARRRQPVRDRNERLYQSNLDGAE